MVYVYRKCNGFLCIGHDEEAFYQGRATKIVETDRGKYLVEVDQYSVPGSEDIVEVPAGTEVRSFEVNGNGVAKVVQKGSRKYLPLDDRLMPIE